MKISLRTSLLSLIAAVAVASVATTCLDAATADEDAVLAPVNALFAGMHQRDAAAIKASAMPGTSLILMRDGKPSQMSIEAFADRVGKPSPSGKPIAERIHDPLIKIDNDLAVVWAPFDFLVDGKVDHCGTDLFNLIRTDGKWLIASIADTGRKDCPAK